MHELFMNISCRRVSWMVHEMLYCHLNTHSWIIHEILLYLFAWDIQEQFMFCSAWIVHEHFMQKSFLNGSWNALVPFNVHGQFMNCSWTSSWGFDELFMKSVHEHRVNCSRNFHEQFTIISQGRICSNITHESCQMAKSCRIMKDFCQC